MLQPAVLRTASQMKSISQCVPSSHETIPYFHPGNLLPPLSIRDRETNTHKENNDTMAILRRCWGTNELFDLYFNGSIHIGPQEICWFTSDFCLNSGNNRVITLNNVTIYHNNWRLHSGEFPRESAKFLNKYSFSAIFTRIFGLLWWRIQCFTEEPIKL